jgi:phosphoesterase RecJ-like protein
MRWNEVKEILNRSSQVMIVVHENPDGDAWGSALGLALVLKQAGFEPKIARPQAPGILYQFLPGQEMVELIPKDTGTLPEGIPVIALDCGEKSRIEYAVPSGSPLINIDHHESNTFFGDVNVVETVRAATAELLCDCLMEACVLIGSQAATCFYVAIVTDTGYFSFDNVTENTFYITGRLLEQGADLRLVRERLLENRPKGELLLTREVMKNMRFSLDGEIVWSFLGYSFLSESDLLRTETENVMGMMRQTSGVELVVLFREQLPDMVKVSFRTKKFLNANLLANRFSGGGHPRAAGASVRKSLAETMPMVMEAARTFLEEHR